MENKSEFEESVSGFVPVDYVRKINLPKIPNHLLPDLKEWESFGMLERENYTYDLLENKLNKWCQENICDSALFQLVVSTGLHIHKDRSIDGKNFITTGRLVYPVVTGGENVATCFWAADKKTKLGEYVLKAHNWYMLASSNYHSVINTSENAYRLIVTSRFLHEKLEDGDCRL